MSPVVSEKYAFVIGVDTHAATHDFAFVAEETGAVTVIDSLELCWGDVGVVLGDLPVKLAVVS